MLQRRRPLSSVSVERVYSIPTDMDEPTRRSMSRTMLEQLLFLAGNAHVVGDMLHEFAESARRPTEAAVVSGLQKRRAADATAAASGASAATAALHAGAGEGVGEAELDLT